MEHFSQYLKGFESCIAHAVKSGRFGTVERMTTKPNIMQKQPFGIQMGDCIDSGIPFTMDYYGYLKHSNGQVAAIARAMSASPPARFIMAPIVHFPALRMQDIAEIMPAEQFRHFVDFKNDILEARGFKR